MKLKSGEAVKDRPQSHVHDGVVKSLLTETLARVDSQNREFFVAEVDFGQSIGERTCVETSSKDEIVFAQRPKRFGLTRFVKNRKPEPCNSVVVVLKKAVEGHYVLITAFVGTSPQPEPWDERADEKACSFWDSHALIWNTEGVIPESERGVPKVWEKAPTDLELKMALTLCQITGKSLEWDRNGGTFQICGHKGALGYWQRFFRKNDHPHRRSVGETEMIQAFGKATGLFHFYQNFRVEDGAEDLTGEQLLAKVNALLK